VDALDELRASLHRDPRGVADEARRLADAAAARHDDTDLSRALAVLGRARRSLGEIEVAEIDLRSAIEAANAAGSVELASDARVALAGVLSFAGRTDEAFAQLDEAACHGSARVRGYAGLQRAIIEQRAGRLDVALAAYDAALPVLRDDEAVIDVAMVLANRGVIRIQTGALDDAVADLQEASHIFELEGHAFGVAQMQHGLGWAHTRRGDLATALTHLDRAAEQFEQLGHAGLEVAVDRVEALLAAGLVSSAVELGARTADRMAGVGNLSQAAETWLLCSRAARIDGDLQGAAAHAREALDLFQQQGAPGWARAATLEVLRCEDEMGGQVDLGELIELGDAFAAVGNAVGVAAATGIACRRAARAGDLQLADGMAARCRSSARAAGVLEVRLLSAQADVSCALARGADSAALERAREALDDLTRHAASLGASDARAAVRESGAALARMALGAALASGSAADVLEWMELARANRSRHAPARPPEDDVLARDLAELRELTKEMRTADGDDVTTSFDRLRSLEDAIRQRALRTGATGGDDRPTMSAEQLAISLRGRLVVEVACVGDELVAVVVDDGVCRLERCGPFAPLAGAAATATSALRSLSSSRRVGRSEALLEQAVALLDDVVGPLVAGCGHVSLVLPPELHAVPWMLLPSCRGRRPVVAPSATWLAEHLHALPSDAAHVVCVAGPRLAYADEEVDLIASSVAGATVLKGRDASVAAVLAALPRARVAHLAAHGHLRHDNALWSSVELVDGPLCVFDLERLPSTPAVVVLSACDSGVSARAGDELLGLSSTLLGRGTCSLVASVCPLADEAETASVMAKLHEHIASGVAPAAALDELATSAGDREQAVLRGLVVFGVR
jgi:tetratricopeptide (TPR) repeat protein